jgi:peroxiredoxin
MAIPTTVLIDPDSKVLWMSQATDFRVRLHPEQVLAQVRAALSRAEPSPAPVRSGYAAEEL